MEQVQSNQKNALTIAETARVYGIPEYCVRTLVKQHKFPVIQSGTRSYILRSVFESYLATGGEMYRAH